jgi:uncharacterized protein (DUF488 family)
VRLYSIGHSTRSADELVEMLEAAGVTRLADVRAIPRSRTNPQFNSDNVAKTLELQGIDYRHMPELGGRRGARRDHPSRNVYWKVQAFRNYADYAETSAFRTALDELERLARERRTAIMCAEAVWWRCHRRLIADYLLVRGWEVVHLMAPGQAQPAALTPGAVPQPDGTIAYIGDATHSLPFDGR